MSWTIEKTTTGEPVLLIDGSDSGYGKIIDVSVPLDPNYEDELVKMILAKRDDLLLSLEVFEHSTEFSKAFHDRDFSSHDFVKCWRELEDGPTEFPNEFRTAENGYMSPIDNGIQNVNPLPENSKEEDAPPKKRRRKAGTVSGRKRAILAWERNLRGETDAFGVRFGAAGWPPSFATLVEEMRHRLTTETCKNEDWDADDVAMLRKYYYLKHKIPVSNTSTIAIHIKVASMSPRCYGLAKEIIALFEAGNMEKTLKKGAVLTMHSSYFDFLYNIDVRDMEEKVYKMLEKVIAERKRPPRETINHIEQNAQGDKEKREARLKDELAKMKSNLAQAKMELLSCQKDVHEEKRNVLSLTKALQIKEDEVKKLESLLETSTKRVNKCEDDVDYLSSTLSKANEELNKMKNICANVRQENESLRVKLDTSQSEITVTGKKDHEHRPDLEGEIQRLRTSHNKKAQSLQNREEGIQSQRQNSIEDHANNFQNVNEDLPSGEEMPDQDLGDKISEIHNQELNLGDEVVEKVSSLY